MKILQINSVYKVGSTGRIAKALNDLIIKNGWQSYIGYGRGEHSDENAIKIGTKTDMFLHGLGTRLLDRHGLFSKKATKQFIDTIDKLDIDIFHLHNIHGYYLHYPTLFKYFREKKVIWTLHDTWPFTGHCAHYDYIGCDKWQTVCHNCPQTKRYPASLFVDNSKNNFLLKKELFSSLKDLTIVTPSRWLSDEVKKSFLSDFPVQVIHNGIDLEQFRYREGDFQRKYSIENKFIILGVANVWDERKGLKYFVELSKIIDKNDQIVIVGLTKEQKSDLPENIIGITQTDSVQELVEIYSSADVLVNPTLEDNFPTTNLEALACQTPVITFRTGGSVEAIDDQTGIVVTKGDTDGLLQGIETIKTWEPTITTQACRHRAETFFDKDKNFQKYIEFYKERV